MKTFYVTKYAMTRGILEITADEPVNMWLYWKGEDGKQDSCFREGDEWHRTRESALSKANALKKTTIKSLTERLKQARQMNFD